jgi:hypothetical protein
MHQTSTGTPCSILTSACPACGAPRGRVPCPAPGAQPGPRGAGEPGLRYCQALQQQQARQGGRQQRQQGGQAPVGATQPHRAGGVRPARRGVPQLWIACVPSRHTPRVPSCGSQTYPGHSRIDKVMLHHTGLCLWSSSSRKDAHHPLTERKERARGGRKQQQPGRTLPFGLTVLCGQEAYVLNAPTTLAYALPPAASLSRLLPT